MIFYINHFSLIILIIQFGKALNHSGLLVQVSFDAVLRPVQKGYDNHHLS